MKIFTYYKHNNIAEIHHIGATTPARRITINPYSYILQFGDCPIPIDFISHEPNFGLEYEILPDRIVYYVSTHASGVTVFDNDCALITIYTDTDSYQTAVYNNSWVSDFIFDRECTCNNCSDRISYNRSLTILYLTGMLEISIATNNISDSFAFYKELNRNGVVEYAKPSDDVVVYCLEDINGPIELAI